MITKRMRALALTMSALLCNSALPAITSAASGDCGVIINEVCAKNTMGITTGSGAYCDWIELYNTTSAPVSLTGYGLSDKQTKPFQYTFPETVIPAGGYLIVFADSSVISPTDRMAQFGLSTSGETVFLTNPSGLTADSLTFPELADDVTFGSYPNGSDSFERLSPTPKASNDTATRLRDVAEPVFSAESGFYSEGFDLTISAPSDTAIYYTTDGSDPTTKSTRYIYSSSLSIKDRSAEPNIYSMISDVTNRTFHEPHITVDKATIIRAIAVDSEGFVSDTVTKSYFIGYETKSDYYFDIPVVSLVSDPLNLFGAENGIYVRGKKYTDYVNSAAYSPDYTYWAMPANYNYSGELWERPANMTYFNADGSFGFSQDVGIRIRGNFSRVFSQKSLNVHARDEYGNDRIEYPIFDNLYSEYDGNAINEFKSIIIRNGGNDINSVKFRDTLCSKLIENRIATQEARPCIVFVDGEYWGIETLIEKYSKKYLEYHFGVDGDNCTILKNNAVDEGLTESLDEFSALIEYCVENDLSVSDCYEYVAERIDIQDFIDYICIQVMAGNIDGVYNNWSMWRLDEPYDSTSEYTDGRWRSLLFDMDSTLGFKDPDSKRSASSGVNMYTFIDSLSDTPLSKLFTNLCKNDGFRKQFVLTYMDLMNTEFKVDNFNEIFDELAAEYRNPMIDYFMRYGLAADNDDDVVDEGEGEDIDWTTEQLYERAEALIDRELEGLRTVYPKRYGYVITQTSKYFSLEKTKTTILTIKSENGGVHLNTVDPDLSSGSWSGQYFEDYPVTLTAKPAEGYKFAGWFLSGLGKYYSGDWQSETISVKLSGAATVTAVYVEENSEYYFYGDINENGVIDMLDALSILKHIAYIDLLDGKKLELADINRDGLVNAADAQKILRISAYLE